MNNSQHTIYRGLSGLGLTASGKRKIVSAAAYDKFFPKTVSTDPIINKDGSVHDTVDYCSEIVSKTLGDTKQIAQFLKKKTLNETCKAIFNFYYKHFQYHTDKDGVEQLRRPARSFKDRVKGIDCDCFTISVSSILTNLGIPHYLRIVKMYNRKYYQHIYVIIPKSANADVSVRENYYVIDPVVDKYDLEAPGITETKDKKITPTMNGIPIQYLNGTEQGERFGNEMQGLGVAADLNADFLKRMKNHLVKTHNHIHTHPHHFAHIYKPHVLKKMFSQAISSWDNPQQRTQMLSHLSNIEHTALQNHLQGIGDIIHGSDDQLFGLLNADQETINGLGALGRKAKKKNGFFTKLKNGVKKVGAAVKKAGKGALALAKKVGHIVMKVNPLTLAIRGGFLVAMKTNFAKIASRLYWGYFPLADAKKAGVSEDYWNRAVKGIAMISKVFHTIGGEDKNLRKAIITGRAAKKVKTHAMTGLGSICGIDYIINGGMTTNLQGLGTVTGATIATAMTVLTGVIAAIGKIFKGKKDGTTVNENGTETPEDNTNSSTPTNTVADDNSGAAYDKVVANDPTSNPANIPDDGGASKVDAMFNSDDSGSDTSTSGARKKFDPSSAKSAALDVTNNNTDDSQTPAADTTANADGSTPGDAATDDNTVKNADGTSTTTNADGSTTTKDAKGKEIAATSAPKSKMPLILGGVGLAAVAIYMATKGKGKDKEKKTTTGSIGKVTKHKTKKSLKAKLK